jgi:hypothetical protein
MGFISARKGKAEGAKQEKEVRDSMSRSSHNGKKLKRKGGKLLLSATAFAVMAAFALAAALLASPAQADTSYATVTGHAAFTEDANHPEYWGDNCSKLDEPGGDSYVLPAGTYTKVIVKAGAGEYANTIFAAPPKAGETVWADTNGNNVFDPDGRGGDKTISHVIMCEGTPTPPTDVCPNIPDHQSEVPPGMVKDEAGNCVTTPTPPTDVCPNIPDNQSEVPPGMVKDEAGNCVTTPTPPSSNCQEGYTWDDLNHNGVLDSDECIKIEGTPTGNHPKPTPKPGPKPTTVSTPTALADTGWTTDTAQVMQHSDSSERSMWLSVAGVLTLLSFGSAGIGVVRRRQGGER